MNRRLDAVNLAAIVSVGDLHGNIIDANERFSEISGYSKEELIGKNHNIVNSGYHSKEFFQQMWATINSGQVWKGQVKNRKKNGEFYWVHVIISPVFDEENNIKEYFSLRIDITESKVLEERLELERVKNIHMSRLSAIGEMASSIAHEINNPLSIINGYLSKTLRKLSSKDLLMQLSEIIDLSEKMKTQIFRIKKIIDGLREFSRSNESFELEVVSFNKIAENVSDLCFERLKSMGIDFKVQNSEIQFNCNMIQIEQVIINLVNNAADAILNQEIKWIKLGAEIKNNFFEISVTDSGDGIPSDVAARIMEPFFTTKEVGRGTGLGLSISKGIIEKHRGELIFDTASKNTKFIVKIPTDL